MVKRGCEALRSEVCGVALPEVIDSGVAEVNHEWQKAEYERSIKRLKVKLPDLKNGSDDWLPTPHGMTLSEALSNVPQLGDVLRGRKVLELGAGVGNHTVLIERLSPAQLTVTEITEDRLDTTRRALECNGIDTSKVKFEVADWLHVSANSGAQSEDDKFDVVITNPPFCQSGQRNRRYFIDELILNSHRVLNPEGYLVYIQSSMANLAKSVSRLQENNFDVEIVYRKQFPWRHYYFKDPKFMAESDAIDNGYEVKDDGKRYETLYVLVCKQRPYKVYLSHDPVKKADKVADQAASDLHA